MNREMKLAWYHKTKLRAIQILNEAEPSKPLPEVVIDNSFAEQVAQARAKASAPVVKETRAEKRRKQYCEAKMRILLKE